MLNDNDLRKVHDKMLYILDEFVKICDKNNLKYWLDAGTLLGAVRHSGFIPWDDDIDVGMHYEDYCKFIEIAKKELPSDLFLQIKETDPHCRNYFAKIRDNRSRIIETSEKDGEKYHQGIFLDIFPYVNIKEAKIDKFLLLKHLFVKVYVKTLLRKILPRFLNIFGSLLIFFFSRETISKLFIGEMYSDSIDGYFVFDIQVPYNRSKFVCKKDIFPLDNLSFCGKSYSVPNNYDKYLRFIYGSYMEIPPEDKRVSHSSKVVFL